MTQGSKISQKSVTYYLNGLLLDFVSADDKVVSVAPERNMGDSDRVTIVALTRFKQHILDALLVNKIANSERFSKIFRTN